MVRTLFQAEKLFDDKYDLIISYADIIYQLNILEKLKETKGDIVITSDENWENLWSKRMKNYLKDIETFKTDSKGLIKEIGNKSKNKKDIEAQYIGLIKISKGKQKEILEIYNNSFSKSIYDNLDMTSFLQYLIDHNFMLSPSYISNGWLEFDTTKDLYKYNNLQDKNKLHKLYKIEEYNDIDNILNKICFIKNLKGKNYKDFSTINYIRNVKNNNYRLNKNLINCAKKIARKIEISNTLYDSYNFEDFIPNNKSKKLSNDLIILLLASFVKIYYITNDITFLNTILKGFDRHIKKDIGSKILIKLKEITYNEVTIYYEK